jgi:hypothetical protein
MKSKPKTIDIWKQMSPAALGKLALAVFLIFAAFGPTASLMKSELHLLSWRFILVQSFASGALAASIILFGRRRWWVNLLITLFWGGVMTLNSGAIGIVVTDQGNIRTELVGPSDRSTESSRSIDRPVTLQPAELNAIYSQRTVVGLMAIGFLTFGYVMFIKVIGSEVRSRSRLETEFKIAENIQKSLLPPEVYASAWCRIAGMTIPATEVGGDYFDIVELSPTQIAVCIADVTGHGVGAGILAAMTKSAFRMQLGYDPSPGALLSRLNDTLVQVSSNKMFVTFAYALLDKGSGRMHIATAGHPPVLLIGAGDDPIREIRTPSLALGMKRGAPFNEAALPLTRNTALCLYTDGLLEARNRAGEEFGLARLTAGLRASGSVPERMNEVVMSDLSAFRGDVPLEDDISLVSLSFL